MIRVLVAIAILFGAAGAEAHELRPAYLDISQTGEDSFDVLWKVPARGGLNLAIDAALPADCVETSPVRAYRADGASVRRWSTDCRDGLAGKTLTIAGLVATYTDAIVRIGWLDGTAQTARLTPDAPSLVVATSPSAADTAWTYFLLGIEHILLGIDHLLFVLALLLLIRGTRRLIAAITAFTVAHSITLAAAALGFTHVPQMPVEAVIALSIVFVAAETIRQSRGETDLSMRNPWLIAFGFGLLHGFGFGGALTEIGLPQKDVPLALLTFNLGVEAGQLAFVAVVLLVVAGAKRLVVTQTTLPRQLASYAIGSLAAFWFVERTAAIVTM